jgi:hypothetical protein
MIRNVLMFTAALAFMAPAAAQTPTTKEAVEAVKITAKITAIDSAARKVTVVGPKGRAVTLNVSDQVKNFPQMKVGDEVVLRYLEAVSVSLEKSTAERSSTTTNSGPLTAAPGAMPAIGATKTTTIVANVQSVDTATQSVVLEGPNGNYVEVKVKDPAVFKQVKANDKVKITYTEAALLSVETPAK